MYKYVELVKDNRTDINTTSHLPLQIWPDLTCKMHKNLITDEGQVSGKKKMFPTPWKFSEEKKLSDISNNNNIHKYCQSVMHMSKRPVTCPYINCQKAIAISSLPSHFLYEHKSVPYLHTAAGANIGLELSLSDIKYNGITCIMLISVLESTTESFDEESSSVKPTLLLMAVKLPTFPIVEKGDNVSQDEDQSLTTESAPSVSCCPVDKILIWVASNTPVNYSYTLCATAADSSKRVKYFGPMTVLDEKYTKICNEARGLVISQHQINCLTLNGTNPILLDVIIHD